MPHTEKVQARVTLVVAGAERTPPVLWSLFGDTCTAGFDPPEDALIPSAIDLTTSDCGQDVHLAIDTSRVQLPDTGSTRDLEETVLVPVDLSSVCP